MSRLIDSMGRARIELCVDHLRWTRRLGQIIWRTLLSLSAKLRSGHPRRSRTLACAKWHCARDAYMGCKSLKTL